MAKIQIQAASMCLTVLTFPNTKEGGRGIHHYATYVLFLVGCAEVKVLFLGMDDFEMPAALVILLSLWLALSWVPPRGICFGES